MSGDPRPWCPPVIKRPREPHKAALPASRAPLTAPTRPPLPPVTKPAPAAPARDPEREPRHKRRMAPTVVREIRSHAASLAAARRRLRSTIIAAYHWTEAPPDAPAWAVYDAAPVPLKVQWRDRAEILFSLEQKGQ